MSAASSPSGVRGRVPEAKAFLVDQFVVNFLSATIQNYSEKRGEEYCHFEAFASDLYNLILNIIA